MNDRHDNWLEAAEKQATDDQSVIDHLVQIFSPMGSVPAPREPISVQSATIYNQIRRTQTLDFDRRSLFKID